MRRLYIIDTVLVVVLTEVMAFWFMEVAYKRLVMVIALVLTLTIARILAIWFSPSRLRRKIKYDERLVVRDEK